MGAPAPFLTARCCAHVCPSELVAPEKEKDLVPNLLPRRKRKLEELVTRHLGRGGGVTDDDIKSSVLHGGCFLSFLLAFFLSFTSVYHGGRALAGFAGNRHFRARSATQLLPHLEHPQWMLWADVNRCSTPLTLASFSQSPAQAGAT